MHIHIRRGRALLSVLIVLTVLGPPGHVRAANDIRSVGTLERFPPEAFEAFGDFFRGIVDESRMLSGTLLPVPEAGQLWQLFRSTVTEQAKTGVLVRDARTLDVIGSFIVNTRLERATSAAGYGGEWLHTNDRAGRIFVVGRPRRLLEIDTASFTVRDRGELSVLGTGLNLSGLDMLAIGGLTYDPVAGEVLVLYGGPPNSTVANRTTVLQRIDPVTGTRTNRVVRSCTGPLPATDLTGHSLAAVVLAEADAVHVPCQREIHAPGLGTVSSSIVVRLPRSDLWEADGQEGPLTVGGPMDSALPDPAVGRITVLDTAGRLTVVDTRAGTVVGSVETSTGGSGRVGPGIDTDTGRVFFQSDGGFGYVDTRAPTPAAPTVSASAAAEGQERVLSVGKRVLALPGVALDKGEQFTIHRVN